MSTKAQRSAAAKKGWRTRRRNPSTTKTAHPKNVVTTAAYALRKCRLWHNGVETLSSRGSILILSVSGPTAAEKRDNLDRALTCLRRGGIRHKLIRTYRAQRGGSNVLYAHLEVSSYPYRLSAYPPG